MADGDVTEEGLERLIKEVEGFYSEQWRKWRSTTIDETCDKCRHSGVRVVEKNGEFVKAQYTVHCKRMPPTVSGLSDVEGDDWPNSVDLVVLAEGSCSEFTADPLKMERAIVKDVLEILRDHWRSS